jgi:hypothetical protein
VEISIWNGQRLTDTQDPIFIIPLRSVLRHSIAKLKTKQNKTTAASRGLYLLPMAQDKKKQEAIKRLEKLLYYFPYMSENILLRDQIIEIYNLLSDQDYAKD